MSDRASSSPTSPRPLTSGIAETDRDAWRALVEKALKGADFERKMVTETTDGLKIQPIYARGDIMNEAAAPGVSPFTRGTKPEIDGLGWQIHQFIVDAQPETANANSLEELNAGTNGIVLQVEAPGQPGVAIQSSGDIAKALTGIALDLAPVQLKAGLRGPEVARLFLDALDVLKSDHDTVLAHLNVDPIGTWARHGGLNTPLSEAIGEAAALAKEVLAKLPKARTINVDATIYHEAGATEVQELAALAATLTAYLKAFDDHGLEPSRALKTISFTLSATDDIFTTLAKLRAARRIIARIAEAFEAGDAARHLHITTRTSEAMMTKRDPWTNLLRATVACASSAFGGADAITVHPFTWPLGRPDSFARRIARNTQIVCQEESGLGRVVDPAGGSWYIENLTNDLAKAAWAAFQAIEADGGLEASLRSNTLQNQIDAKRTERAMAIATGRQNVTGVSAFPILGDDGVKVEPWPAPDVVNVARDITPVAPHRLAEAFEQLRDQADTLARQTGKPPQVFLANIGRVADHNLRSTWIKNFLAAGGIEALSNDGFANIEDAVQAFSASDTKAACICSSDDLNREHAAPLAKALKAAGAEMIMYAGRPAQDHEPELNTAGVDQYLFAGLDAVMTLSGLQNRLT
jgi:methylmalonyl-CoA mutase